MGSLLLALGSTGALQHLRGGSFRFQKLSFMQVHMIKGEYTIQPMDPRTSLALSCKPMECDQLYLIAPLHTQTWFLTYQSQ